MFIFGGDWLGCRFALSVEAAVELEAAPALSLTVLSSNNSTNFVLRASVLSFPICL